MNNPIVRLSSIHKQFGGAYVLGGLDWQVLPGQVIGLLGRNGAGKSTLLECLLGLRETDAGSVTIHGEDVRQLSDATRARIGYVPQKSDLFEWMTPRQMLDYFKALYPRWNDAKVDALLQRWGFDQRMQGKAIGKLSGGEQQRLSIIRALGPDPDLLILDEPVSALDPVGRRDFLRELIDGVIEQGTTVVFSTHILSDLERVALDVAFLKDGRIALQGQLDALLEGARRVVGPGALLDGVTLAGEVRRQRSRDGSVSVVTHDGAGLGAIGGQPGVRVESLSLEDLFIEVTQ
ncbi:MULTISPECIES: ABC transporter ATP-binding protein [unclassified Massilia]|uniref:ABC transporter ATP-binding protein n=1 Tax=unclassified Massilia TaxID=2609279 RepID=UPI00178718FB|nr:MULTISPECIES: ABC transporter ATP-binding protein [unclassified Massilia]MBD8529202.1 ABC transporter ATP-binding protein [Massilia sp. CFBP 13647]MBD8672596.1 ABC transporter ATP-binding protein [Massilia sp. CFBP 13721]